MLLLVKGVVSFTFGLLHGLGFAGALAQGGLPARAIPIALVFFNLGVEIGQLLFVAAVVALLALGREAIRRRRPAAAPRPSLLLRLAPSYAIGAVAMFWVIQRVTRFETRGCVLHFVTMSHTITVRLTKELAEWLEEAASRTGVPQGRIVREQLEKARTRRAARSFMRLAGSVRGPRDLSRRKGFSRT